MPARSVRTVGDYVRQVGNVKFSLGQSIEPERVVAAFILAAAGGLAPDAEFHFVGNVAD